MSFSPLRAEDLESRLRHLEREHLRLAASLETALASLAQGVSGDTTGGGMAAIIAASGGGGGSSGTTTLNGDVTGPSGANTVEAIQNFAIPAPVAGDDEKFIKYQHATPAFEYSHIDRIQNQAIAAGTTAGDIWYFNGTAWVLLTPAAGDTYKVLAYVHGSTAPDYLTLPFKQRTETANYTATADDLVIFADATGGAITITLPPVTAHKCFVITKVDAAANAVTVDGDSAETINGAATYVLGLQFESIIIVGTTTQWFVVAS